MNWEHHFRNMSRHEVGFGGILLADNLRAVNDYFHRTQAITPQAQKLASDWSAWWIETGDPDNYMWLVPDEVWDEARNRRLAFDRANAITPQEKQQVETVARTGMTTETQQGEADRRDPMTGEYHVPPANPPLMKRWWFWPVVGVSTGLLLPKALRFLIPIP